MKKWIQVQQVEASTLSIVWENLTTSKTVGRRDPLAQTMVKMYDDKSQTKEVYRKVENINIEVRSRSEPQKKPQVV